MADDFREKGGKRAATVALAANVFLTVFNIVVGLTTGSSALVSEGAHTFTDIVTTVIAYAGFRFSQKPADFEHPLGYGRAESLSGLFVVLFLVIVAWEVIEKAVKDILFFHDYSVMSYEVAVMAVIGIVVNLIVSSYLIRMGKQIKSPAIVADGYHQRTDVFSSVAILVGVFISNIGFPVFDPIISILIGLLIFRTAVKLFIMNYNYIVGKIPSDEFIRDIENIANSVPGASNAHDIKVDYMGNYAVVALHVEIDGEMRLNDSHKIAHEIQDKILEEKQEVRYAIVHTCPVGSEYNHNQRINQTESDD